MYTYNIAKNPDNKAFKNTCAQIESKMSDLKKEKLLIDVDGSVIQIYRSPTGKITIFNDYLVGAVYVDSEIDLGDVLK